MKELRGRKAERSTIVTGNISGFFITACKLVNSTGMLTDCSIDCCEGELCNGISGTTTKPQPTSDAFGLVASFGAILFVFVLNMFA